MENTLEMKQFFAQYWGQEAAIKFPHEDEHKFKINSSNFDYVEYIELTPLEQISDIIALEAAEKIRHFFSKVVRTNKYIYVTDKYNDFEDALETLRIYYNGEVFYLDEKGKVCELSMEQSEEVISFFRSKGIAYQFNGITVEEQIKRGYIKLNQYKP